METAEVTTAEEYQNESSRVEHVALEPEDDDEEEAVDEGESNERDVDMDESRNGTTDAGATTTQEEEHHHPPSSSETDRRVGDSTNNEEKKADEPSKIPAANLSILRPTLRGVLDAETGSWTGEWAMSDQDYELGVRGKFEYRRSATSTPDADVGKPPTVEGQPSDMFVSGYFTLQTLQNPHQTIPKRENDILIRFVASPGGDIIVQGSGKNEFGIFSLSGKYDPTTRALEVYRAYQPRPEPSSKSSSSKSKKKAPPTTPASSSSSRKTPRSLPPPPQGRGGLATTEPGQLTWDGAMAAAAGPAAAVNQRVRRPPMHVVELGEEESRVKSRMQGLIDTLLSMDRARFFHQPVDPVRDGVPLYFDIIKEPMDLGTVKKNLQTGAYRSEEEVATDVNLTFANAMTFNPVENVVYKEAKNLLTKFESEYQKILARREAEREKKRKAQAAAAPQPSKNGKRTKVSSQRQSSSGRSDPDYSDDDSMDSAPHSRGSSHHHKQVQRQSSGGSSSQGGGGGGGGARDDELRRLREEVQRLSHLMTQTITAGIPTRGSGGGGGMDHEDAYVPPARKRARAPPKPKPAPVAQDLDDDEEYIGGGGGGGGGGVVAAPRAPRAERPLSYQEKRALGEDINLLPGDKIQRVLDIIAESGSQPIGDGAEEVEIDIEKLDTATLKRLQKYVKEALRDEKKRTGEA